MTASLWPPGLASHLVSLLPSTLLRSVLRSCFALLPEAELSSSLAQAASSLLGLSYPHASFRTEPTPVCQKAVPEPPRFILPQRLALSLPRGFPELTACSACPLSFLLAP